MKKSRPDLSFIIPAYNAEAFLAEALSSCVAQDHKNIEIVVVDDASMDSTLKVATFYASRDPRVHVVRHEANKGSGAARNTGCAMATAPILAMLDADDMAAKNRARETIKALKETKGLAYFYSGAVVVNSLDEEMAKVFASPFKLDAAIKEKVNKIVHSTAAFHASLWQEFPFDEDVFVKLAMEDWHQQLRIAKAGYEFVFSPKFLSAYRVSDGQSANREMDKVAKAKDEFLGSLK